MENRKLFIFTVVNINKILRPVADPIIFFSQLNKTLLFFSVKLGHFIINEFFLHVTNLQA